MYQTSPLLVREHPHIDSAPGLSSKHSQLPKAWDAPNTAVTEFQLRGSQDRHCREHSLAYIFITREKLIYLYMVQGCCRQMVISRAWKHQNLLLGKYGINFKCDFQIHYTEWVLTPDPNLCCHMAWHQCSPKFLTTDTRGGFQKHLRALKSKSSLIFTCE